MRNAQIKTLVHIGQHKTGTTSIQHYMRDHADELRDQGLYVPDILAGFRATSHFILNVHALADDRYSTAKTNLLASKDQAFFAELESTLIRDIQYHYALAEKQQCHSVVWSNEGLYLLNSVTEYQKLIALFSPYSSAVVSLCCFREKADFRKSYRNHLEKKGITTTEENDSYRNLSETSWLVDYDRKKALLAECFDDQLDFSYQPDDNVEAFFSVIGLPVAETRHYRLNVAV